MRVFSLKFYINNTAEKVNLEHRRESVPLCLELKVLYIYIYIFFFFAKIGLFE
jgi:hypothetical protein